jgi:hypothetical protein
MYGEDGWCPDCGVPRHAQCGSLVLQRKGFDRCEGGWVPNWQFDVICLEQSLANRLAEDFNLDLRKVAWNSSPLGEATQLVVPTIGDAWFDMTELRSAAIARHGTDGARCAGCGVWRWMPLSFDFLPPVRATPALGEVVIAASPEWFGDGWKAFRQILVRRDLAELIAQASPKDFVVKSVIGF